jgi:hypothetical protein
VRKKASIGPAYAQINGDQGDRARHPVASPVVWVAENRGGQVGNSSWAKPEEGLRLMHAFLSIKQAEVRERIIQYVTEQSKHQKDP